MRNPEQLRGLAEEYVRDLALTPELGALEDPIRYALEAARRRLETTEDAEAATEVLSELAEIAREIEAELAEARRRAEEDAREEP